MGLHLKTLLTEQLAQCQANQSKSPGYTKQRVEKFEQVEKSYYKKNPLNYAIRHTFKAHFVFKDGNTRTFIALVARSTYNSYLQGYPPIFDYSTAFTELVNLIKIKYKGKYKTASIYECYDLKSREILKFDYDIEKPAKHPFTGELPTEIKINLTKLPGYVSAPTNV
jgi:hypothetical protein